MNCMLFLSNFVDFIIRMSLLRYVFGSIYLNLEMFMYVRRNEESHSCWYYVVVFIGALLTVSSLPLLLVSWLNDLVLSLIFMLLSNCTSNIYPNFSSSQGISDHCTGINVMSYNIQVGRGMDNKINLPRLNDVINKQITEKNINILALQEVEWDNPGCCETGDQVSEIQNGSQFDYCERIKVRRNVIGLGGGIFGAAICIKDKNFEILDVRTVDYPHWWLRNNRNLIATKIGIKNKDPYQYIWIVNTHLQNDPTFDQNYYQLKFAMNFCDELIKGEEEEQQIDIIPDKINTPKLNYNSLGQVSDENNVNNGACNGTFSAVNGKQHKTKGEFAGLIFIGDLNLPSWTSAINMLQWKMKQCVQGLTFPSNNPKTQFDHIFLHKTKHNKIQFLDSFVINEQMASDHRPVVATFCV